MNAYNWPRAAGFWKAAGIVAMELFWSLLQKNVSDQQLRPQDRLGGLAPIEFETELDRTETIAASTTIVTKTCTTPNRLNRVFHHDVLRRRGIGRIEPKHLKIGIRGPGV